MDAKKENAIYNGILLGSLIAAAPFTMAILGAIRFLVRPKKDLDFSQPHSITPPPKKVNNVDDDDDEFLFC